MTADSQPDETEQNVVTRRHSGQYAGKTATARSRERRSKLLNAGVRLIGRDGFAATSIDAICAEAGLTKRYFYAAFSSREELLTAAYEAVTREFVAAIMQEAGPHLGDPRALVRAGLTGTFGFVAAHPDKARLMMVEATSVRSQLGQVYGKGYDQFVNLLVGFTKPFLKAPQPSDRTLRVLAKGVVGSILHLCQGWLATDFKQPAEELIDGMEMIMGGLGVQLGIAGWVRAVDTSAPDPGQSKD